MMVTVIASIFLLSLPARRAWQPDEVVASDRRECGNPLRLLRSPASDAGSLAMPKRGSRLLRPDAPRND